MTKFKSWAEGIPLTPAARETDFKTHPKSGGPGGIRLTLAADNAGRTANNKP